MNLYVNNENKVRPSASLSERLTSALKRLSVQSRRTEGRTFFFQSVETSKGREEKDGEAQDD